MYLLHFIFLQTFFFFITKTIFKPLTHQRILITWQNYTIYLEERSLHSTDSQRHDKSGLKSQQHCELCGLCLFLFTCLPPYAFPFVCLHFYMHHGSLACFPDPLPWCHQETRVPTITSPTLRLSVSLEEGARRGSRSWWWWGTQGRPCVFDRSVFVDDFSASPPMLTEVDCAGSSSENSCFWHTLCKECVCVTWGLIVSVCVCAWVGVMILLKVLTLDLSV